MLEEKQLMQEIKKGEVKLVGVLFERYHLPIFNFFLRLGVSKSAAEDLVQETFIRVIKYRDSYDDKGSFSAWCYKIARNIVSDYFKKPDNSVGFCDWDDDIAVGSSHGQESDYQEQQSRFKLALSQLSFEHREIIVLSRYQQLPYQEIARLLDCNVNTLKARIRAAINSLKRQYDELSGDNHG
ncbi:RNA polymerase sigma factor [Planctobacterium marinum]|uniref:RNA polymerase sigma factor n=1 Tax=Planctobacterium marinum TaxID=1631968 RepID=UPI001E55D507|nr:RNA polymerase sigma factor [Planctobacterium marinum]MCC2607750.1 RNA polymerase sigma factor [Planctobacterium marinum]